VSFLDGILSDSADAAVGVVIERSEGWRRRPRRRQLRQQVSRGAGRLGRRRRVSLIAGWEGYSSYAQVVTYRSLAPMIVLVKSLRACRAAGGGRHLLSRLAFGVRLKGGHDGLQLSG
jgi:hypothetical protein